MSGMSNMGHGLDKVPGMRAVACVLARGFAPLVLLAGLAGLGFGQGSGVGVGEQLLQAIAPRELGPVNMGGRVHNLAVYEKEPRIFYVATASGGLWRTDGGGVRFRPVFQYEDSVALGDVAVDQDNPDVVWVGTGEENNRNSTSWGDGVYRTEDGGRSWSHMGLKETRHISTVKLHPTNKAVVYAGALGALWNESDERGLYKSVDGGKSWSKVLFVNNRTGVIDMVMDPRRPDTLIVAMYERFRWPWRFESGGVGSGLYKSTDGGKSWRKITRGLPEGATLGRIGLSQFRKNPDVLIMTLEASAGRGVYKSTDLGESWTFLNNLNPRPFYFSTPRIDPSEEERVYIPGVNFHFSVDGGKNFRTMQMDIHVDHHDLWIDPRDSNHMILANDGGVAQTRDRGATWEHLNNLPIGQFYAIGVDMRRPYWVYGGLQDNGTWGGPTQTNRGTVTFADFRFVNGGDGFHAQVDPTDWRIVYAESQGGALVRHNMETGERAFIRPRAPEGESYRFNWSSPIHLSPHNPSTVWFGGNRLFKSVNRGDSWTASQDLTTNDPEKQRNRGGVTPEDTGAERHCTIVTISESPLKAGVVWVGTDDGLVQLTQDDGKTWMEVGKNVPGVPAGTWVSRVAASRHVLGRAYVAFDGHRFGDKRAYLFVTEDFGASWQALGGSFPEHHVVYSFAEGHVNPDLLAVGTEMGLWVSFDRGGAWSRFHRENGFPTVRVDDLVIHPRELDLVVGTHGRSIWILPWAPLEQLTARAREQDVFLCRPGDVYSFGRVFPGWFEGDRVWGSPNTQPGTTFYYWLKGGTSEKVEVVVKTAGGEQVARLTGTGRAGLNGVVWRPGGRLGTMRTGDYVVELLVGDKSFTTTLRYENLVGTAMGPGSAGTGEEDEEDGLAFLLAGSRG